MDYNSALTVPFAFFIAGALIVLAIRELIRIVRDRRASNRQKLTGRQALDVLVDDHSKET